MGLMHAAAASAARRASQARLPTAEHASQTPQCHSSARHTSSAAQLLDMFLKIPQLVMASQAWCRLEGLQQLHTQLWGGEMDVCLGPAKHALVEIMFKHPMSAQALVSFMTYKGCMSWLVSFTKAALVMDAKVCGSHAPKCTRDDANNARLLPSQSGERLSRPAVLSLGTS
eukprot:CAMPEP_0202367064 /NCGR_PEP_ID=MMETSP1126-20121109/17432_1 /ASSEMBLY_ACC=CAM_ASM_000457 /TAXON_ID=3047 /ORGANISM="Dunaliella tertiolecta, Strain CCMP1320" /LENGTH=170 /DNA_ID=CAMNT_0048962253 /DNA_START=296 /DNA_END=809 /DNA_ORIENTATION=+